MGVIDLTECRNLIGKFTVEKGKPIKRGGEKMGENIPKLL
jgi:hypothetical protein